MKKIFFIMLLFSFSSHAGYIPLFDLDGNAENGGEFINITDTTSLGFGLGDSTAILRAQFGGGNSGNSRGFGLALWNPFTSTIDNQLQIFNSGHLNNPIKFSNILWDFNTQLLTTSYGDMTIGAGQQLGFYFSSDGDTTYSWSAANTGSNAGDHFGFYSPDITSPFDLTVYGSDADSGKNLDYAWVSFTDAKVSAVPEPSSMMLFGLALLAFGLIRKREFTM